MTQAELLALIADKFRDGVPYAESFSERLTSIFTALIEDGSVILRSEAAAPDGDSVVIAAQDATGTDGNGGNVTITLGAEDGTGDPGNLVVAGLPTADPLVDNALWLNTGVLTISAGAA